MATTIDLPADTEEQLRRLAEQTGVSVSQLVVESVQEMLAQRPDASPRPRRPIEGIIGMFPGGGVKATEFDEWLNAARAADPRFTRTSSTRD